MEEEIIGADGKKQTKKIKKTLNYDGSETIEEECVDDNGNVIIIKKKQYKDKEGNTITEEEKLDTKTGLRQASKSKKDPSGKETFE